MTTTPCKVWTVASARPTSNYGLPAVRTYLANPAVRKALRESWGSEHSMDSLASINSILSEEAAAATATAAAASSPAAPPKPTSSRPPLPLPGKCSSNSGKAAADNPPGKAEYSIYDRPRPIDRGAACQAQQGGNSIDMGRFSSRFSGHF